MKDVAEICRADRDGRGACFLVSGDGDRMTSEALRTASIRTYGETLHSFMQRDGYRFPARLRDP